MLLNRMFSRNMVQKIKIKTNARKIQRFVYKETNNKKNDKDKKNK